MGVICVRGLTKGLTRASAKSIIPSNPRCVRALSSASQNSPELLQGILNGILAPYWERTPTAEEAVEALEEHYSECCICWDHFAFRTFGVEGLGISSLSKLFTDFGYQQRSPGLTFPAKKLEALWFSPPHQALPRIFISQLKVEQLSQNAQAVIKRYTQEADLLGRYAALSSVLGVQPWPTPSLADYHLLAKESEYAAWVLVNGYALNHTTVSVHHLKGPRDIYELNEFLQAQGFTLNAEGGVTKVSPDGLLLQSSTVADRINYTFAEDLTEPVPGAYIEFAERRVLPQFAHLKPEDVTERERRDGFEAGNADKIFESTTLAAKEK